MSGVGRGASATMPAWMKDQLSRASPPGRGGRRSPDRDVRRRSPARSRSRSPRRSRSRSPPRRRSPSPFRGRSRSPRRSPPRRQFSPPRERRFASNDPLPKVGDVLRGTCTRIQPFGAFVKLEGFRREGKHCFCCWTYFDSAFRVDSYFATGRTSR